MHVVITTKCITLRLYLATNFKHKIVYEVIKFSFSTKNTMLFPFQLIRWQIPYLFNYKSEIHGVFNKRFLNSRIVGGVKFDTLFL